MNEDKLTDVEGIVATQAEIDFYVEPMKRLFPEAVSELSDCKIVQLAKELDDVWQYHLRDFYVEPMKRLFPQVSGDDIWVFVMAQELEGEWKKHITIDGDSVPLSQLVACGTFDKNGVLMPKGTECYYQDEDGAYWSRRFC